ncbi:hypothetical protein ROS217_07919 [Roseovarius sp. 217]|nr:hypothetical protein ROS217_07919 [Roseovarius sp. 217]
MTFLFIFLAFQIDNVSIKVQKNVISD